VNVNSSAITARQPDVPKLICVSMFYFTFTPSQRKLTADSI
jgi:hypothetical protein